jgi:CO/xanthine dehydrogenase Mo-binding subunit
MGIEDGRVIVSNLGDYKIFCVRDVPPLVTSFVTSTVGPGPFSAKAVGEAGISIVAPAIANPIPTIKDRRSRGRVSPTQKIPLMSYRETSPCVNNLPFRPGALLSRRRGYLFAALMSE